MSQSDAIFARNVGVVSAEIFLQAKIKEYEAACFGGSIARVREAEENCRTALQGLLDLKSEQAVFLMNCFRQ
jgi:hypothetical protein